MSDAEDETKCALMPWGSWVGGTPILQGCSELILFLTFSDPIKSLFYAQLNLIDPLFCITNLLSLLHFSSRDNVPNIGKFFQKKSVM